MAGFSLLMLAWVFGSAPYQGPDEQVHYLRGAAIASGTLLGPPGVTTGSSAAQTTWLTSHTRRERIDTRLMPPGLGCKPVPAARQCIAPNYAGNYQPLPYLLPAVAARLSIAFADQSHVTNRANRAMWIGRLASAFQCLLFLVLAFALLWRGTTWSVVGLLVALTPSTLFLASVINPDGLEIAANITFFAGLLRLTDSGSRAPRWVWAAIALSAAVVVLSWHLGWVFVSVEAALAAILVGAEPVRALISRRSREARVTAAVLVLALAVYVGWGLSAGLLHGTFNASPPTAGVSDGIDQLRIMLYGAVGLFGPLNIALPADGYYWTWWILALALLALGVVVASGRERGVLALASLVAFAYPVLLYAWVLRHADFSLQPRYVMPLFGLLPLLGGELIYRSHQRQSSRWIRYAPAAVIALIGCYELMAWWVNARASAGKPTVFWFLTPPGWAPPHGWVPWTIAAALGALALVTAAAVDSASARRSVDFSRSNEPRTPRLLGSSSPRT